GTRLGRPRRHRACPHLSEKMGGVTPLRTPQPAIPPGLPSKHAVSGGKKSDKPPPSPVARRGVRAGQGLPSRESPDRGSLSRYSDSACARNSPTVALAFAASTLSSSFNCSPARVFGRPGGYALCRLTPTSRRASGSPWAVSVPVPHRGRGSRFSPLVTMEE